MSACHLTIFYKCQPRPAIIQTVFTVGTTALCGFLCIFLCFEFVAPALHLFLFCQLIQSSQKLTSPMLPDFFIRLVKLPYNTVYAKVTGPSVFAGKF